MAFFGVTHLGYQDTIREHVRDPEHTPQYIYRSGLYRDPSQIRLPPIGRDTQNPDIAGQGSAPQVSYKEYQRRLHKHVTTPQEPQEVYRKAVTTSAEIGKWRKDDPLKEREPWSYVKRHVHINSEMTRFVKDMSLTNRDFSLF